jgi:hypothetical protein
MGMASNEVMRLIPLVRLFTNSAFPGPFPIFVTTIKRPDYLSASAKELAQRNCQSDCRFVAFRQLGGFDYTRQRDIEFASAPFPLLISMYDLA